MQTLSKTGKKTTCFENGERWNIAHNEEFAGWEKMLDEFGKDNFANLHRQYFQKLLERLHINIKGDEYILDVGCGPSGILNVIPGCKKVGVDPLADRYKNLLKPDPTVTYVNSKIEDFSPPSQFDIVFSFNAIDHVDDINLAINKMNDLLKAGGTMVVGVNYHNYRLLALYYRLFNRWLEPPHPSAPLYREGIFENARAKWKTY